MQSSQPVYDSDRRPARFGSGTPAQGALRLARAALLLVTLLIPLTVSLFGIMQWHVYLPGQTQAQSENIPALNVSQLKPTAPAIAQQLPTHESAPQAIPTEPPTSTPIQELGPLAQKADIIVEAVLTQTQPVMHSWVFQIEVTKWLKRPEDLVLNTGTLWIGYSNGAYEFDYTAELSAGIGRDSILFLSRGGTTPWDGTPQYMLADTPSGYMRVDSGIIGYSGLRQYKGWTVQQLEAQIATYVPAPPSVSASEQSLASLGYASRIIAEVEVAPAPQPRLLPDQRTLINVKVVKWLKNTTSSEQEYLGLVLSPQQLALLSHVGSRYVLFLVQNETSDPCESFRLSGYYKLVEDPPGIFEVQGDTITSSPINGYTGMALADFEATLLRVVQVPALLTPPPLDFLYLMRLGEIIAHVEVPAVQPNARTEVIVDVKEWLRKPADFSGDKIKVDLDEFSSCSIAPGDKRYILLLQSGDAMSKFPIGGGPRDLYHITAAPLGIFAVRDGVIDYTGMAHYWGWPLDRFKTEINSLLNKMQPTGKP